MRRLLIRRSPYLNGSRITKRLVKPREGGVGVGAFPTPPTPPDPMPEPRPDENIEIKPLNLRSELGT
ncbi:hypothetical protein EYF80_033692 [Liparis tanakae]|uniref:Uncharacterized protein n=1 Tax=Liparis tanakae TaxID=230148 RepID=A0A4Z2GRY2_9TELE|nr:hypothetical protein EYF80_033692 [Liparis tanakae]